MSGLCRTLAAGRSSRSCKLPARLKEYVLPGQEAASCKVSTRHQAVSRRAASQAEELCPKASHSQQHPPAPTKRIIVKLCMKASGMGQGRALQLQANQASPALLSQAGRKQETDATPPADSSAHAEVPTTAPAAKPFRVAPVERPVTRRFSLHQRSSSKLKLRIKLKRSTATTNQQPQRMSTLQHQQKRHARTHHNTAKHDSSTSHSVTPSAAVLHDPAFSKATASAQVASLTGTATVAASGSTTQHPAPAACRQPETAGGYSSRPWPTGAPCSGSTVTAADAHPLPVAAQGSRVEAAALCSAAKPKLPPAVFKDQHGCAAPTSAAQHAGAFTQPCTKQR